MIKKLFLSVIILGTAHFGFSQSVDINPINGNRGQSLPVVISGQNTSFVSQGSPTANLFLTQGTYVLGQGTQTAFTNITVIDPLTIMANLHIPQNAPLGLYELYVSAGSTASKPQAFTVNPMSSASITVSPDGSKPGVTSSVTISVPGGSFKTQAQVIEKVWFTMGTEILADVNNITVVNSTTFTADVTVPTGASIGMYDVNIYTDDDMMFTTSAAFLVDPTFSTPELEAVKFNLYPNPANDFIVVEYEASLTKKLELQVTDLSGRNVTNRVRFQQNGDNSQKVDLTNLIDGVYMIRMIVDGDMIGTRKFVKE